jgi:prolactin regulatory element-binding protein
MITLFDFSSRAPNVESCAELDVSQDDSVTCLANLATKNGLILYAGNGSSEEDKAQGKDLHFRSFDVQFGKSKPADSSEEKPCQILPLSKTMLFRSAKSETARKEVYQRLVRLSPAQRTTSSTPNKRIGAIASALAGEENEVVIFSATSNRPQPQDIIQRVSLGGREANDLDIIDQGEGRFQVAYVLDQDVYVHNIHYDFDLGKSRAGSDGVKVYTVPHPDIGESKARPALRGVRWLTSKHLLLLANQPNRSGVELKVLHAYQDGTWSIVSRKTLKSHVTAATDMDVAILDSDSSGAYQVAVAIAGADFSLSVGTMDYFGPDRDSLSQFHLLATYHQVSLVRLVARAEVTKLRSMAIQ